MSHPLLLPLSTLTRLLETQPSLAASKDLVKVLDKVATATASAIALFESAAAGNSPEAEALTQLLTRAFAQPADEKILRTQLASLLGKLPAKSAKLSPEENLRRLVEIIVRQSKIPAVQTLIHQHLNRVSFDTRSGDKYELLKQIRALGQMAAQEKKAAKLWLLDHPGIVQDLCEAAGLATTIGKAHKPVALSGLVTKLMQHGERYAENTGD